MNDNQKAVVITGASSGIGRACVLKMSQAGWHVFAAVRKPSDGDALRAEAGDKVSPIMMDVADHSSITAAAHQVGSQLNGSGLDGLANVAGIGLVRPLEYAPIADLREIFEINVFGQIAVTQAFLPLLRQNRGRVVNVTSVGAHIAIPFGGLLNGSKCAFAMLSDTLRLELHPFGIHVCAVEPGAISTPAVEKTLGDAETVTQNMPAEGQRRYSSLFRGFAQRAYAREKDGSSPDVVAEAVHHALTSNHPRIRYRVGNHARLLATLAAVLPDRLLDRVRLRLVGLPTGFGALADGDKS